MVWSGKSRLYKREVDMNKTSMESLSSEILLISADAVIKSTNRSLAFEMPSAKIMVDNVPLGTLLKRDDSQRYRALWYKIQSKFKDDPRAAISEADGLVAEIVEKITRSSTNQNPALEDRLIDCDDITTEDLIHALQYYRSFLNQMNI
jgi:hypothetical protein